MKLVQAAPRSRCREVALRPSEQNLDSNAGASLHPHNHAASHHMLQEVLKELNSIVFHEPQSADMQPAYLEIASLFGALHAVTDYSFYDRALLAKSQL